ncbi:MAG TPA: outer membrane beta-barrel protein [Candidatus Acidoferrales bacterium]|nr:outer membrane beta-barrel protein [Candidatus Acidoferrales bacterium]
MLFTVSGQDVRAQERAGSSTVKVVTTEPRPDTSEGPQPARRISTQHEWHYGGFVDLGYMLDFNHPANHLFRNRGTTPRVNELDLNMAGLYLNKDASAKSRFGMELLLQAGQDSKEFGFSATAPNLPGAHWLSQLGRANVSYLAPVGRGLTVQAGIFNSLIGYESLYAKDNFTYTRSWGADYSPYLMMGVNATYPFTNKLTGTLFVINGYFHLAHPNNSPSFGGQIAYQATEQLALKETLFYGPQQSNTALEYWRFFTDSIAEWKEKPVTTAFEYQAGTENLAAGGNPRVFWTAAQLPVHWAVKGPWSVTVRPEILLDPDGRMTESRQFVKAVTITLEYRVPCRWTNTIARLEYRFDDSTGRGGGFFRDGYAQPGLVQLTPTQHLLVFGLIWTLDP